MVVKKLKSLSFTLVMTLMVMPLAGQVTSSASDDEKSPGIQFETKTHDFGKIPKGKDATCSFKFTNTGDAPLTLKDVRPSCGCTAPKWPRKPIMPGETASIKAVYDAASPGRFQKSITVKTNVKDNSRVILTIKGRVQKKN
jgi:hypothetical protein